MGGERVADYRERLMRVRSRQGKVAASRVQASESGAELAQLRAENRRLQQRIEALERGLYQKEKSIGAALYRQNRAKAALRQQERRFVLEIGSSLVDAEQQTAKETRWTLRSPEYQEFAGDAPQPEFAQGMFMQRME